MKDVNIKVDFNQKRICNNVVITGGFMKLDENAIRIATAKNGKHKLNQQTFIIWQALCITYFKEEQTAITKNLGLSTKYIADNYGFNKRVVQRAIEELVEKGWLVNVREELWALVVPAEEDASAEEIEAVESIEETDSAEEIEEPEVEGVCTSSTPDDGGMYQKYTGVCTASTQGYVLEVHRGVYQQYTQSIIKEEEEVEEQIDTDNMYYDIPSNNKSTYKPANISNEDAEWLFG